MYLTVWIISNNIRIYRIWFAHGTREDSLTSSLITLDDICWSFVLAGSGPVTWRNFQISNCERCLTKVRTQSMKRRRNMRQKMIMRRTKMTWMMSWMRWCWCRTQTEALSVSELQSSVQDSLLRSWTSDWPSANAFYRQIVCACVGGKGCYSRTVQKMAPKSLMGNSTVILLPSLKSCCFSVTTHQSVRGSTLIVYCTDKYASYVTWIFHFIQSKIEKWFWHGCWVL